MPRPVRAADLSGSIYPDELFKPTKHGPPVNPARVKLPADFGTNRYFEKRARDKLQHENDAVAAPMHPLAVGRDREALVICEAGCMNEAEQVVYSRPRVELKPSTFDTTMMAGMVSIDALPKKLIPGPAWTASQGASDPMPRIDNMTGGQVVRGQFGRRHSLSGNAALTAVGKHTRIERVSVRGRGMRMFSGGMGAVALAIAVSSVSGYYRALADETVVAEAAAERKTSGFAMAAAAGAGTPSSVALNVANGDQGETSKADAAYTAQQGADPAPCKFVPHAQAALALAATQQSSKVDEYGKLMSVPEDGMGNTGDLPATNRRVRELIAANPDYEMVICVAGCGNTDRVVFRQPKEVNQVAKAKVEPEAGINAGPASADVALAEKPAASESKDAIR